MKVVSGIPLPSKFPFAEMKVGDSFEVPSDIKRATVGVAAMRYGKKFNAKFTVRILNGNLHCWRIA